MLVAGEIAGTWRRAGSVVEIDQWRPFSADERETVEADAVALPLPGSDSPVRVRWGS